MALRSTERCSPATVSAQDENLFSARVQLSF
jgi:hypothetical protein